MLGFALALAASVARAQGDPPAPVDSVLSPEIAAEGRSAEDLADAYIRRAKMHYYGKRVEQELADYDHAIAVAPDYANGYLCRGKAALDHKEYDRAIEAFTRVIALAPDNPVGYTLRAMAWEGKQEYDRAIEDYDRILTSNPKDWRAIYGRAVALSIQDKLNEAIENLDRAIEVVPDSYAGQREYRIGGMLAQCPRQTTDYEFVSFYVRNQYSPSKAQMFALRGANWFNKGAYERALTDLDQAIDLGGLSGFANFHRGLTRLALGKCAMGMNDLRLAARFGSVPLEQLQAIARGFIESTPCADFEP